MAWVTCGLGKWWHHLWRLGKQKEERISFGQV